MDKKEHMIINQKKYIELCKEGKTRSEISEELGITLRTISKYQSELGVYAKREHSYNESLKQYEKMCNQGYTRKEISEKMHVSLKTVTNYINATGIYPKSEKKKANVDESFFDVINTEEKAYILGFIFADGYIDAEEKNLCLNINKKDLDILTKIKTAMHCGNSFSKSSTKNCIRLNISSKHLVSKLKQYGMVRNKTRTLPFPILDDWLYRHFFRGYCDGDGCVHKRQVTVIIGSKNFFDGYVGFLTNTFNKHISTAFIKNSFYTVVFSRKDIDIVTWMYENSKIYLDRKYSSYIENWFSYAEKRRSRG